jgi:Lrp/AsnC family leucine-responsive transcriptional regulator
MHYALDDDDIRILQLLQHDARLTTKEIGDKIGKSTTPVYERIKKLQEKGYILRYVAILNNKLIQKNLTAYTQIHLKEHAQDSLLQFEREVIKLNEVMECYHMTGAFDYLLKIAVKDMEEYYDFAVNKLAHISNLETVQTFFALHEAKNNTAYSLELGQRKIKMKLEK